MSARDQPREFRSAGRSTTCPRPPPSTLPWRPNISHFSVAIFSPPVRLRNVLLLRGGRSIPSARQPSWRGISGRYPFRVALEIVLVLRLRLPERAPALQPRHDPCPQSPTASTSAEIRSPRDAPAASRRREARRAISSRRLSLPCPVSASSVVDRKKSSEQVAVYYVLLGVEDDPRSRRRAFVVAVRRVPTVPARRCKPTRARSRPAASGQVLHAPETPTPPRAPSSFITDSLLALRPFFTVIRAVGRRPRPAKPDPLLSRKRPHAPPGTCVRISARPFRDLGPRPCPPPSPAPRSTAQGIDVYIGKVE